MALFAIGDLHLGLSVDKPMNIFGEMWEKHEEKIKENWIKKISENDSIIIPGDISWATDFDDAVMDLQWIDNLPGKKYLLRGNHDFWWSSLKKMNDRFPSLNFIQNNFYSYKDYGICGTRGWTCPNKISFDSHDRKIFDREVIRLKLSLDEAKNHGYNNIVVAMHYPPTNEDFEMSEFTKIFEEYRVKKVIYGHLHTESSFGAGIKGMVNGVEYILSSSDYLGFDPIEILD